MKSNKIQRKPGWPSRWTLATCSLTRREEEDRGRERETASRRPDVDRGAPAIIELGAQPVHLRQHSSVSMSRSPFALPLRLLLFFVSFSSSFFFFFVFFVHSVPPHPPSSVLFLFHSFSSSSGSPKSQKARHAAQTAASASTIPKSGRPLQNPLQFNSPTPRPRLPHPHLKLGAASVGPAHSRLEADSSVSSVDGPHQLFHAGIVPSFSYRLSRNKLF